MTEREPELVLNFGEGGEFTMNRDNAALFTFLGDKATRNHIFLVTGESSDNSTLGTYIFSHAAVYNELSNYMVVNDYPLHLNMREVPNCDEQAFQSSLNQLTGSMTEDYIPDDWGV